MNAKEMFKELDCDVKTDDEEFLRYTKGLFDDWSIDVRFDKKEKTIYSNLSINIRTLKAINQQCKELGWSE